MWNETKILQYNGNILEQNIVLLILWTNFHIKYSKYLKNNSIWEPFSTIFQEPRIQIQK